MASWVAWTWPRRRSSDRLGPARAGSPVEVVTVGPQPNRTDSGFAYDLMGRGVTRLLLLHGGSARRGWFGDTCALLSNELRMVVPDLPGHGDSAATPGSYRLEDSAAAVAEVLQAAGGGPCWVFGHSHGAHVAAVLAVDRPDLVEGLVLGDAPMSRARMRQHLTSTFATIRSWRALTDEGLTEADVRDGLRACVVAGPAGSATLGELFGPDHPYLREMAQSLHQHDGDFLDAISVRFDDTYRRLDDDLLAGARIPVTVVRADPTRGGLLTDDDVDFIRRRVPHARVEQLRGVGHGLQSEDPASVAEVLRRAVLAR